MYRLICGVCDVRLVLLLVVQLFCVLLSIVLVEFCRILGYFLIARFRILLFVLALVLVFRILNLYCSNLA